MMHSSGNRGKGRASAKAVVLRRGDDVGDDAIRDLSEAASRIVTVALNDFLAGQGRPPLPGREDHAAATLRHIIETDGERFIVAVCDGRPVGFGAGIVRGLFSYCAGLFVLPEWQGQGLGRRLFEAALQGLPVAEGVTALTSGAANPISNGLYARHGIYPQYALLALSGPTAAFADTTGDRGRGFEVEPLAAAHLDELRAIDDGVLGFDRTPDHLWFLERRHPGWLFRRRGRAVAYGYLGGDETEAAGSVGPIAALSPSDQTADLGLLLHELALRGEEQATVLVPGPNLVAQRALWDAGFAFTGATGLLCASRPFARLDRYVLAGDSIM
jgi:GNAT superfamily N-acetyltransferase